MRRNASRHQHQHPPPPTPCQIRIFAALTSPIIHWFVQVLDYQLHIHWKGLLHLHHLTSRSLIIWMMYPSLIFQTRYMIESLLLSPTNPLHHLLFPHPHVTTTTITIIVTLRDQQINLRAIMFIIIIIFNLILRV